MPIAECPHCRRKISDAVPACPFCGRDPTEEASTATAPPTEGYRSYLDDEAPVSDDWRRFATAYAQLPPSGRWSEWAKLSAEQKEHFSRAWRALGYNAAELPPRWSPAADGPTSAAGKQVEAVPPSRCGNCGGTGFTPLAEQPNKGTGCILLAIGALLAPVLIGIVIIIWALNMMGDTKRWWVCNSCGARLPRTGPVKTAAGWR